MDWDLLFFTIIIYEEIIIFNFFVTLPLIQIFYFSISKELEFFKIIDVCINVSVGCIYKHVFINILLWGMHEDSS